MRKRRLGEDSAEEVAQFSVVEVREAHQASEDSEVDIREQASNSKDEVATNTTITEVGEEDPEEVGDLGGGTMTSHNGIETRQSTFDQTGR
jgi:hypothetical protein